MRTVALIFAAALAACAPESEAPPPKPDPAAIDTTLRWHEVTVEDRTDVGDPAQLREPGRGGVYVVVRYSTTNEGETRLPMSDLPMIRLIDPNGRAAYPDPTATDVFRSEVNSGVERTREGDLNPGVSIRQGVVFELAANAWSKPGWQFQVGDDPETLSPLSLPSTAAAP